MAAASAVLNDILNTMSKIFGQYKAKKFHRLSKNGLMVYRHGLSSVSYILIVQSRRFKSSHRRCSVIEGVLKNRLWHRCFLVNFAKFLRTPLLQITSGRLVLQVVNLLDIITYCFGWSIFEVYVYTALFG